MTGRRFFWSTIEDSAPVLPFISTWRTTNTSTGSSTSTQVKLPLVSTGTYSFNVDWGDGNSDNITVWNQSEVTHTYGSTGDYTITITGTCNGWRFANTGDRLKILTISQWGNINFLAILSAGTGSFYGCSNLDVTATDTPIFASASAAISFFRACTSLIGNSSFNNWDVSNNTSFEFMFNGASSFNQNIGSWDVGLGTNFNGMFTSTAFNNGGSDSIKDWNVSSGQVFGGGVSGMFRNSPFNQPIGTWDMGNATSLQEMFNSNAAFNQNIGSWNVSNVTIYTSFMASKTAATFSTTNLDAIYNGWTNRSLSPSEVITFGTAKYTAASTAARALLTRANATVSVTNAANNGSGLIRITTGAAHGITTGDKIFISGVTGTTEANGGWISTVIDATTVDLQASTFTNAYVSGGTFRIGYGWTITDGGI